MKKNILEFAKLIFLAIILTPITALTMSEVTGTSINTFGVAWLIYIISYILFPKIISGKCKINKLHKMICFIIFYFAICTIFLIFLLIC